MGLCDLCKEHTKTRHRIHGETLYYLTNILARHLKKMTDDELLKLYKWIQEGLMVCTDCHDLCKKVKEECHSGASMRLYNFRRETDKKDLEKIETEIQRRIIMRRALKGLKR